MPVITRPRIMLRPFGDEDAGLLNSVASDALIPLITTVLGSGRAETGLRQLAGVLAGMSQGDRDVLLLVSLAELPLADDGCGQWPGHPAARPHTQRRSGGRGVRSLQR
jgi:hypothetical protein